MPATDPHNAFIKLVIRYLLRTETPRGYKKIGALGHGSRPVNAFSTLCNSLLVDPLLASLIEERRVQSVRLAIACS